jgi:hypothetical protein
MVRPGDDDPVVENRNVERPLGGFELVPRHGDEHCVEVHLREFRKHDVGLRCCSR